MHTVATYGLAAVPLLTGAASATLAQELALVVNRGKFKQQGTTVTVIDFSTRTVLGEIEVGAFPTNLALSPDRRFMYVTLTAGDGLAVVSLETLSLVATIPLGSAPMDVAITPDGQFAYVTDQTDHNVSVIRLSDHTVVETITGPEPDTTGAEFYIDTPHGIAFTPDGRFAYVGNISFWRDSNPNITVIRTADNTLVETPECCGVNLNASTSGFGPWDVTALPDGSAVYANSSDSGEELFAVDSNPDSPTFNQVVATLPVGSVAEAGPRGMENGVTPAGLRVFAGLAQSSEVAVVDSTVPAVVATVPIVNSESPGDGAWPWRVRLNTAGTQLWVSLRDENKVMVLDSTTYGEIARLPVKDPADILFVPYTADIDIKPKNRANRVNVRSRGSVSIAIFGEPGFDVSEIDVSTLEFGPAKAPAGQDPRRQQGRVSGPGRAVPRPRDRHRVRRRRGHPARPDAHRVGVHRNRRGQPDRMRQEQVGLGQEEEGEEVGLIQEQQQEEEQVQVEVVIHGWHSATHLSSGDGGRDALGRRRLGPATGAGHTGTRACAAARAGRIVGCQPGRSGRRISIGRHPTGRPIPGSRTPAVGRPDPTRHLHLRLRPPA